MVNEKSQTKPSDIECAMCGRDGGPVAECQLCQGSSRFAQKRHFTLSEERQGLNEEERNSRYGRYGGVMPKIVNLPGSINPMQGTPNKS